MLTTPSHKESKQQASTVVTTDPPTNNKRDVLSQEIESTVAKRQRIIVDDNQPIKRLYKVPTDSSSYAIDIPSSALKFVMDAIRDNFGIETEKKPN